MIADRTTGAPRKRFIFDGVYQVLSTVGHGRTSIVYKARRLPTADSQRGENLLVALKVLTGNSKDPELNLARMKREAVAMLSSRHQNVVRLIDFVTAGDLCYLCMEYADRGDLGAELQRHGKPLSADAAVRFVTQVASGLEAVHHAGILHRDIKPENLLLTMDGRIKIADFGLAHLPLEGSESDESKRGVGTFDYLAPECLAASECSPSSDLYSAAVTLYQLLTCHLPFAGTSFTQSINNKISGHRAPLSKYRNEELPQFEKFLNRALATDPRSRFQTAGDFKKGLADLLSASPQIVVATGRCRPSLVTIERRDTEHDEPQDASISSEFAEENQIQTEPKDKAESPPCGAKRPTVTMRPRPATALCRAIDAYWSALPPKRRALYLTVPLTLLMAAVLIRVAGSSTAIASSDAAADRLFSRRPVEAPTANAFVGVFGSGPRQKAGVLYDLFSDENHLPVALIGLDSQRALFVLGLPGWAPQAVDIERFSLGEEIRLASSGLDLSLWANQAPNIKGAVLSGRYREHLSGREGSWVLSR